MIGIWTLVGSLRLRFFSLSEAISKLVGVLHSVVVLVRLADWCAEPLSVGDNVPGESPM